MFSHMDSSGAGSPYMPEVQESVLGQAKDQKTKETTIGQMAKGKSKEMEQPLDERLLGQPVGLTWV